MPCASRTPRNSSTLTSRLGAECRSEASGRSRRITCAWQSIARTSTGRNPAAEIAMESAYDHRPARTALDGRAVFRLELRRGEEALFECLDLRERHDLV